MWETFLLDAARWHAADKRFVCGAMADKRLRPSPAPGFRELSQIYPPLRVTAAFPQWGGGVTGVRSHLVDIFKSQGRL